MLSSERKSLCNAYMNSGINTMTTVTEYHKRNIFSFCFRTMSSRVLNSMYCHEHSQTASAFETPREIIPISPAAVNCLTQTSIESSKETRPFKAKGIKITYPNDVTT